MRIRGPIVGAVVVLAAAASPAHAQTSAEEWTERGLAKAKAGDYPAAIAFYEKVLALDAKDAEALYLRGAARARTGDLDGAIADCDAAIDIDDAEAQAAKARGRAKLTKGNRDAASAELEDAAVRLVRMAAAYHQRGCAKLQKDDSHGALADFGRAIRIDDRTARYRISRAGVRLSLGDLRGAIADCDRAIAIDPTHGLAYRTRALAKRRQGDHAGADADEAQLKAARTRSQEEARERHEARTAAEAANPDRFVPVPKASPTQAREAAALARSAQSKLFKKDLEGALADYDKAIEISPFDEEARCSRARARLDAGDYDGAVADSNEVIRRINPKTFLPYLVRGCVRTRRGDLGGAISDFTHVNELLPRHVLGTFFLGRAKVLAGEEESGLALLEKACNLKSVPSLGPLLLAGLSGDLSHVRPLSESKEGPARRVARYLMGTSSEADLLAWAEQKGKVERSMAHAYIGLRAERDHRAKAIEHYRMSVAAGAYGVQEHGWAEARLHTWGAGE